MNFDVIVVGAGHAGIEAAHAAATMSCSIGLITMDKNAIGRMSCNPAIGGTAKGHLVREIDALGGVMGKIADATGIQFRMLNTSNGPAVWSPRCQSDRDLYSLEAARVIISNPNITLIEDSVIEVITADQILTGVITQKEIFYSCKALILSSGTFLNGLMHTGLKSTSGGRFGEMHSTGVTESLLKLGFESARLKTGTPPRLKRDSINWGILSEQAGDVNPQPFSHFTDRSKFPMLQQVSCHITYTDKEVHAILEKGFHESPLFTGVIKGMGPRYCPSIEDKIVRFAERERHQLFLEPEGLNSDLIYVNGFSSSLPADIQIKALKKVKGLEECEMVRPGYAVEYDFFPPHQVDLTLETKLIKGLYFAGQINGTSGYEEAAAQGLVAGINAAAKILQMPEFVLHRSEAYIGVLIDDLVTKSTDEPYRMFTSRAEHRLILRQDNADRRLFKYGVKYKLLNTEAGEYILKKENQITEAINNCNTTKVHARVINPFLEKRGLNGIDSTESISKICKRPELLLSEIIAHINGDGSTLNQLRHNPEILEQVQIEIKYEGYIKKEYDTIAKQEKSEFTRIPLNFDFQKIRALSTEGREKLNRIKPRSIGQASRISGVTPSDISILLVYLKN